jgi:aminocarboxymuconate-semialdehyde decarboxylase
LPKGNAGNLDDPTLDAFWQAASDLKAAVFMHPMFLCGEPRLVDYDLVNAIGRLADTSIAVSRLLFSGHLLKFPGMKFVLSHGGAALPYALGRLARNHAISQGKYADPRKGFEAMYFDSCVFDADSLEYLARKAGSARIMLGSDQPFPIGDPEPRKVVEGAYFNEAQKKGILGDTAQTVFRVRADCWCPR